MVYWWWEVAVTFLKQGVCDLVDLHPAGLEDLHELIQGFQVMVLIAQVHELIEGL